MLEDCKYGKCIWIRMTLPHGIYMAPPLGATFSSWDCYDWPIKQNAPSFLIHIHFPYLQSPSIPLFPTTAIYLTLSLHSIFYLLIDPLILTQNHLDTYIMCSYAGRQGHGLYLLSYTI